MGRGKTDGLMLIIIPLVPSPLLYFGRGELEAGEYLGLVFPFILIGIGVLVVSVFRRTR